MSVPIKIKKRVAGILFFMTLLLIVLAGRLVWVQLVKGEELRQKAFAVRFRNVEVKAKRGTIYDAQGKPLAISISTDSFMRILLRLKGLNEKKKLPKKLLRYWN